MYEDLRPQSSKPSLFKKIATIAGITALVPLVAIIGVYVASVAEQTSINYRTSDSTEVHRVLGQPYIHLGDRVPVTKVTLGQQFYVHNKYIKTETCHVFVSNVFWGQMANIRPTHHYSMFANWFEAGTFEADEVFTATETLPAGQYKIVKKSISFCNGKEHYTLNFSVPVEFVKP